MILSDQEIEIQMRAAHDWVAATDEQKAGWEAEITEALAAREQARQATQVAYEQQMGLRLSGSRRKPSRKVI
jgi:hypothetical protein